MKRMATNYVKWVDLKLSLSKTPVGTGSDMTGVSPTIIIHGQMVTADPLLLNVNIQHFQFSAATVLYKGRSSRRWVSHFPFNLSIDDLLNYYVIFYFLFSFLLWRPTVWYFLFLCYLLFINYFCLWFAPRPLYLINF